MQLWKMRENTITGLCEVCAVRQTLTVWREEWYLQVAANLPMSFIANRGRVASA